MAPRPVHHPLRDRQTAAGDPDTVRRRAIAAHPAGRARPMTAGAASTAMTDEANTTPPAAAVRRAPAVAPDPAPDPTAEEGSLTTEYGLIVVLGATIVSLVIKWASGGAVFELLDRVISGAGRMVGLS